MKFQPDQNKWYPESPPPPTVADFDSFYEDRKAYVNALLAKRVFNPSDREELAQEAWFGFSKLFLREWRSLSENRRLLTSIVLRRFADHARKQCVRAKHWDRVVEYFGRVEDNRMIIQNSSPEKVQELLDRELTLQQQQIVYFKVIDELSYREIAERMGIKSHVTVRNILFKTLKRLKELFTNEKNEG